MICAASHAARRLSSWSCDPAAITQVPEDSSASGAAPFGKAPSRGRRTSQPYPVKEEIPDFEEEERAPLHSDNPSPEELRRRLFQEAAAGGDSQE